jgi:hypothetical protein
MTGIRGGDATNALVADAMSTNPKLPVIPTFFGRNPFTGTVPSRFDRSGSMKPRITY